MSSIKELVDRGLEVRKQLEDLGEELKGIEEKLKKAGLEREQDHLEDEDREGRRWLAHGTSLVVPVVFTADKLIGSFRLNSPKHTQLRVLAGEDLKTFFQLSQVFESIFDDGKKFRKQAAELLGARGPAFVTACVARDKDGIPKSDIKVQWNQAK